MKYVKELLVSNGGAGRLVVPVTLQRGHVRSWGGAEGISLVYSSNSSVNYVQQAAECTTCIFTRLSSLVNKQVAEFKHEVWQQKKGKYSNQLLSATTTKSS